MLTYYQDSYEENAVDDITRKLHSYVSQVKNPDLEEEYMTLGQKLDRYTNSLLQENTEKVNQQAIDNLLKSLLSAENTTRSSVISILDGTFPDYRSYFMPLIDEHWKE